VSQFTYVGDVPVVFPSVQLADGSTLLAEPGQTYELLTNPQDSLLQAVAQAVAPESAPEAPFDPAA
jgi:hypothetical protein